MKKTAVVKIQDKGQITIPKKWRDEFKTQIFQIIKEDNFLIFYPIEISDEYIWGKAEKIIKKRKKMLASLSKK